MPCLSELEILENRLLIVMMVAVGSRHASRPFNRETRGPSPTASTSSSFCGSIECTPSGGGPSMVIKSRPGRCITRCPPCPSRLSPPPRGSTESYPHSHGTGTPHRATSGRFPTTWASGVALIARLCTPDEAVSTGYPPGLNNLHREFDVHERWVHEAHYSTAFRKGRQQAGD